jgi:hypothetical protein
VDLDDLHAVEVVVLVGEADPEEHPTAQTRPELRRAHARLRPTGGSGIGAPYGSRMIMHSPSLQPSPSSSLHTLKHIPQCIGSHCVLTQTSSQSCSPGSLHSPPVVIVVVPVSGSSVVPPVSPVVDVSLAEDDDVSSELDVLPSVVVGSELDDEFEVDVVGSELASEDDDWPFVLDIESIPVDAALSESPVDPPVSPPSLPQAHRARPTSAENTVGADACT